MDKHSAYYQKIENHSDLVRDVRSGAIINTNSNVVAAARARKQRAAEQTEAIATLQSEMTEIKTLLKELINNNNELR